MIKICWLLAQILGISAVIAGVFLLFGVAVALIVGGVVVAAIAEIRS